MTTPIKLSDLKIGDVFKRKPTSKILFRRCVHIENEKHPEFTDEWIEYCKPYSRYFTLLNKNTIVYIS
jgi:hypothetical protein